MPQYFFDLTENGLIHPDFEGADLAGLQEARREAVEMLADLARDELLDGVAKHFCITVRDAGGPPQIAIHVTLCATGRVNGGDNTPERAR